MNLLRNYPLTQLGTLFTFSIVFILSRAHLKQRDKKQAKQSTYRLENIKDLEEFYSQIKYKREPSLIAQTLPDLKKEPSLAARAATTKEA